MLQAVFLLFLPPLTYRNVGFGSFKALHFLSSVRKGGYRGFSFLSSVRKGGLRGIFGGG